MVLYHILRDGFLKFLFDYKIKTFNFLTFLNFFCIFLKGRKKVYFNHQTKKLGVRNSNSK